LHAGAGSVGGWGGGGGRRCGKFTRARLPNNSISAGNYILLRFFATNLTFKNHGQAVHLHNCLLSSALSTTVCSRLLPPQLSALSTTFFSLHNFLLSLPSFPSLYPPPLLSPPPPPPRRAMYPNDDFSNFWTWPLTSVTSCSILVVRSRHRHRHKRRHMHRF